MSKYILDPGNYQHVLTGIRRNGPGAPYTQSFSSPLNSVTDIGPWGSGEPSTLSNEHCVVLFVSQEAFHDIDCDAYSYEVVCEIEQLS